jgi:pimeloyl-ACP methyl ester carboxylesterase
MRWGKVLLLLTAIVAGLLLAMPQSAQLHAQNAASPTPLPPKYPTALVTLPPKPTLQISAPLATETITMQAVKTPSEVEVLPKSETPVEATAFSTTEANTDEEEAADAVEGDASTETPPATPVPPTPPFEYSPAFEESACPFVLPWSQSIICGALAVPEVRNDPESATISIFVMILKSQSTPLTDPVIVLSGGPGSAGSQSRNLFYTLPTHRNRDIVLLDPRGTGHSYPSLDCFEHNAVGMSFENAGEASRACYERLISEGRDLAGYVSSEQVEDIADLAKVLGFGKINLYATSYGTRVAVQLADKYPALVRSMVLDGVLPVAVNSLLEEPLNDYGVLQRIARDCAQDPRCNGSFPALEARLLEVIDRYNQRPLPGDIGYGSGDDILKFIFKSLYDGGHKIPAFITALYYEDFAQACEILPPSVGCFFNNPDQSEGAFPQIVTVPTEAELLGNIDFFQPEITPQWHHPWTFILPANLVPAIVETTTGTTAAPATDIPAATPNVDAEESPSVEAQADVETPPWRAHFVRPEDPLSPDLDRISWLMHDRGYVRPDDLFAWLDTLTETEVLATLQSIPDTQFDSFSEGVYASVMCAEEAPFYSMQDIATLAARIPQQFGSLPTRRATEVKQLCEFWQVPQVSAAEKMTLPSGVPTLITNGTHDAITPAVWAERAAIYLDKVWLRLFPGYGHAILSTGDACAQEMIGLFYANPNADPSPPCFHDLRLDFLVP